MAHEIKVPPFGESISESTIAQWLKQDGDKVQSGDNLVTLDTEKASSDLQAEASGILRIKVQAGKDVPIGAVIGMIETDGASAGTEAAPKTPDAAAGPEAAIPTKAPLEDRPVAEENTQPKQGAEPVQEPTRSDLAHQVAAPIATIKPASAAHTVGPHKQEGSQSGSALTAVAPAPASTPGQSAERETRRPMSRLRKTLATRLLQARNETAMLTTFTEVDMSEVLRLRKRYQDEFLKQNGIKLGMLSFFVKAVIASLKQYPALNSRIDGDDIVEHHYYDISVAVSTEKGLVVPVIHDADKKTFAEIEKEIGDLAKRARDGKIGLDEMRGGTFTITNGGVFGSMLSTPLLNPPQVGIIGMHAVEERPIAIAGKVEVRPMMYVAMSYDHRLIDGKEAVQFLVQVRDLVAQPDRMLLGL